MSGQFYNALKVVVLLCSFVRGPATSFTTKTFVPTIRLGLQKVMYDLLKWATTIPTTGTVAPSDKNTPEGDFFFLLSDSRCSVVFGSQPRAVNIRTGSLRTADSSGPLMPTGSLLQARGLFKPCQHTLPSRKLKPGPTHNIFIISVKGLLFKDIIMDKSL